MVPIYTVAARFYKDGKAENIELKLERNETEIYLRAPSLYLNCDADKLRRIELALRALTLRDVNLPIVLNLAQKFEYFGWNEDEEDVVFIVTDSGIIQLQKNPGIDFANFLAELLDEAEVCEVMST